MSRNFVFYAFTFFICICNSASYLDAGIVVHLENVEIDESLDPGIFELDILATVTPDAEGQVAGWGGVDLPFLVVPQDDSSGSIQFLSNATTDLGFFLIDVDASRAATNEYFFSASTFFPLVDPPTDGPFTVATLFFEVSEDARGSFDIEPVFADVDGAAVIGEVDRLEATFNGGSVSFVSAVPEPSSFVLVGIPVVLASSRRHRKR